MTSELIRQLAQHGLTLAVAESLTGGLLAARLTEVPGASAVFRGGIVSYATDLKHELLSVDDSLLENKGAVDAEVAQQMAAGVAAKLTADIGLSTTGVAGPDMQDGVPVGTVFIALATSRKAIVEEHHFEGTRNEIRALAVQAAVALLSREIDEISGSGINLA